MNYDCYYFWVPTNEVSTLRIIALVIQIIYGGLIIFGGNKCTIEIVIVHYGLNMCTKAYI